MVKLGCAYYLLPANGARRRGLNVSLFRKASMPTGLPSMAWLTTLPFYRKRQWHVYRRDFGVFMRKGNEYYADCP